MFCVQSLKNVMRSWRLLFLTLTLFSLCPSLVRAHPLGNFTINHLAKVSASRSSLHVRYILDIAEIPTFQIMHQQAGDWDTAAMQRWADSEIAVVQTGLKIDVDGTPVALHPSHAHARLRPGAGGLPILRWVDEFTSPLQPGSTHRVTVDDQVYADRRIGWKDIVVGTQREPTDELQRYPPALIGTPRRINGATFAIAPTGTVYAVIERTDTTPVVGALTSWVAPTVLSGMFSRPNQTPIFIFLTVLAAFGLGSLHAIEPGHGKALLAFTLVGARATAKQALILAASLTFAHTVGVLILGGVLYFAAGFVSESIYPWITLISGVVIAVIGARTLARFVSSHRAASHLHEHSHDGAHPHAHAHGHDGETDSAHGHSHVIPGSQPLNFGSAIWAALSGGVAPCPAAIVVLLAALRLHQLAYGMVLIVIFSFGLATVLSALGLGVVHGAAWLSKRAAFGKIVPYGPLASACVISLIGAWMLSQGFLQQGINAPPLLVASIALAAIAGFAFSRHGHAHVHSASLLEARSV